MTEPPPASRSSRRRRLRHQIDRLDVDIVDAVELGLADLQHRLVAMRPAGVVDDDVEPAERLRTAATAASISAATVTSHFIASADAAGRLGRLASRPSRLRSSHATFAPSAAKRAAMPAPKPDAAPVTMATLPFRRMSISSFAGASLAQFALAQHRKILRAAASNTTWRAARRAPRLRRSGETPASGRSAMITEFANAADAILKGSSTPIPRVPGVVAMATDRHMNVYEGAAGKRRLDRPAEMTTDTVFAIFSTTKAITGTAALQLVEEGKLDLDAPAKTYVPDIGKLQVLEGFDAAGEPKLRAPKREITTRMLLLHTAGLRLRFLQRRLRAAGAGERPAEHRHRDQGGADDAAAVRSRRALGIRLQHRLGRPGRRGDRRQAARRGVQDPHLRAARHGATPRSR